MTRANRRDRSKESYWRDVVTSQAKSGLSVRGFCRQRQVSEHSFYTWRRELRLRSQEAPAFAAVTLQASESRLACDEVEIRLPSDVRIRFRSGTSASWLQAVLPLLGMKSVC